MGRAVQPLAAAPKQMAAGRSGAAGASANKFAVARSSVPHPADLFGSSAKWAGQAGNGAQAVAAATAQAKARVMGAPIQVNSDDDDWFVCLSVSVWRVGGSRAGFAGT